MGKQVRYYIKDSETNELWCFDSRYYSGTAAQNKF
jgi:hypothetical protein